LAVFNVNSWNNYQKNLHQKIQFGMIVGISGKYIRIISLVF
jgi:hypothetical protein